MSKWIFITFFFLFGLVCIPKTHAFTITSDPQYVVMNFATINDLNWVAPEDVWQKDVKPKIRKELDDCMTALPRGTEKRKLAWSTLMEYMNFPMDEPSSNSPYAIKMRRILEITDEINLPLFVPLNGFQWWDELPELYNWWDQDGTHTPKAFFDRMENKSPGFTARFIKGYNPQNKWNVEWQNYTTPMKLNVRNWGGGGFYLAPPPNLLRTSRSQPTYRDVLDKRLTVILNELYKGLEKWEKDGKQNLFAGITIGTEVSLNASITLSDEFIPYGYRGIQDWLCTKDQPTCGIHTKWDSVTLDKARQDVVHSYLNDMTMLALRLGIPKQRIYTHVWGEAELGQPRYASYPSAAFTLYARPGMSFYGYAQDPLSLPNWQKPLATHGYPQWGAVEYSTDKTKSAWEKALKNTLDSPVSPAKVVTLYNWSEHKGTDAIPVLQTYLSQNPKSPDCQVPEIITQEKQYVINPSLFSWQLLSKDNATLSGTLKLHVIKGDLLQTTTGIDSTISLPISDTEFSVARIPIHGLVSWYVEGTGCNLQKRVTSEPHVSVRLVPVPPVSLIHQLLSRLADILWK
jgi:hypothetical protein